MLALCRVRDWPTEGYRLGEHPCQQAMLTEMAAAAEVSATTIPTAVDGCGVVTFALPLASMAAAFGRLEELDGGVAVASAMRAHPELIRGSGALDTKLMQRMPAWTAKGGAEGLLCAAGPNGLGLALKVEDGNGRALQPALAAFLAELGLDRAAFGPAEVRNSRDEVVGEIVVR
jgi:L-asparaginase II